MVCRSVDKKRSRPLAEWSFATHVNRLPMDKLDLLSNEELMAQLLACCANRRSGNVRTLVVLGEVDARELHLAAAASSLWDFCRRFLSMSHGTAFRFATVAPLCRKFPFLLEGIERGELHLTTLTQIAPFVKKAQDPEALIRETAGMKRDAVDRLLVERFGKIAPHISYGPMMPWDSELQDLIDRAHDLFSHASWSRDVLEMTKRAYRLFIAEGEKRLRGKGARAQPPPRKAATNEFSRHATSEIYERHGEQCAFVDERTGARCNSRAFLQKDHVVLRAFGGSSESENGRPLCARHNLFEAKRVLGRDYVEHRIRARQQERRSSQSVSSATRVTSSSPDMNDARDHGRESPR